MNCEKTSGWMSILVGILAVGSMFLGGLFVRCNQLVELTNLRSEVKELREYREPAISLNIACADEDFFEKPKQNKVSILDFDTVSDVTSITITVNKQKFIIVKIGNEVCNVFRIDRDGFAEEQ